MKASEREVIVRVRVEQTDEHNIEYIRQQLVLRGIFGVRVSRHKLTNRPVVVSPAALMRRVRWQPGILSNELYAQFTDPAAARRIGERLIDDGIIHVRTDLGMVPAELAAE